MRFFASLVVLSLLTGCGGDAPPSTTPIEGVMKQKGTPLTKGKVTFHPVTATGQMEKDKNGPLIRPAVGEIGPDGKFVMSTFTKGDGVIPGKYKVTVDSVEEVSMEEFNDGKRPKSLVPKKYNSPQTSGMEVTVPDQSDPYPVTLNLLE